MSDKTHAYEKVKGIDFKSFSRELVRSLRGHVSQTTLNRKLGVRYNKVSAWELGKLEPSWQEFIKILEIKKISLSEVFADLYRYHEPLTDTVKLIAHFTSLIPISDLIKTLDVSRSRFYRWKQGKGDPDMTVIFKIIFLYDNQFLVFINKFCPVHSLPSIKAFKAQNDSIQLFYEEPLIAFILRALEHDSYRHLKQHVDGFISNLYFNTIGLEKEKELLQLLLDADFIAFENGKYITQNKAASLGNVDPAKLMELKGFWAQEMATRLKKGAFEETPIFSYSVFSTNKKTKKLSKLN